MHDKRTITHNRPLDLPGPNLASDNQRNFDETNENDQRFTHNNGFLCRGLMSSSEGKKEIVKLAGYTKRFVPPDDFAFPTVRLSVCLSVSVKVPKALSSLLILDFLQAGGGISSLCHIHRPFIS